MTVKPKIGVLVMALLEDDYNKTAHMRPQATAAAQEIADTFAQWGEVVHAGLVEEEHQLRSSGEPDPGRLRQLEEQLDQCWDLLRQRRAKREYHQETGDAKARSVDTVEHYQQ